MTGHPIRPEHRKRKAALCIVVCLFVFALAGLGACGTELLRARRVTRHAATATVAVPAAWCQARHAAPAHVPAADPAAIQREIASDGRIKPAVARDALNVSVSQSDSGRIAIAITWVDQDPGLAIQSANRLATGYIARRRAEVAREAAERLSGLVAGQDWARRTLQEIRAEVEAIIDRSTSQAEASAAAVSKASAGGTEPGPSSPLAEEPAVPPAGANENPELAEARAKLEELQDRRRGLLLSRTPIHPEVQNLDLRIAECEKQIASIQARIGVGPAAASQRKTPPVQIRPAPKEEPPNASSPAGVSPLVSVMKAVEALRGLKARIDRAASSAGQPAAGEVQALLRLLDEEDIAIEPADRAEAIRAQVRLQDWLALALAAGLVATAGVGFVWTGARLDPPFTSARQIERGLDIPVVGTIPAVALPPGDAGSRSLASAWRWPCISAGLAVVAAYLAFLLLPLVAG